MTHLDIDTRTGGDGPQGRAYEAPAVVVLGSVEAVTLSSRSGSYSDFKGRDTKKPQV